jgi:hypothetical protein
MAADKRKKTNQQNQLNVMGGSPSDDWSEFVVVAKLRERFPSR